MKSLVKLSGCPGWSESALGAQPHCWFCRVAAHVMSGVTFMFPHPMSKTQHSLVSGWTKSLWILLNFWNAYKSPRKVKQNENVCHVQDSGSMPKVTVTSSKISLRGFQGHLSHTVSFFSYSQDCSNEGSQQVLWSISRNYLGFIFKYSHYMGLW